MVRTRLSAGAIGALALAGSLIAPVRATTITVAPIAQNTSVSVTSTCATPERPAALSDAVFVDLPTIAQEQNVSGVTTLRVDISATGKLLAQSVLQSSGNPLLDDEAMRSARLASFAPEISDCHAVGGSYLFRADFTR
jgi:TonB family protein